MGLFDRVLKKEKQEIVEQPTETITIQDLIQKLKESNKEKIESASSKPSILWPDFLLAVPAIEASIKEMDAASFEPQDKTFAAVNMLKDNFVKKAIASIEKMPNAPGSTHQEVKSSFASAVSILNELKNPHPKQSFILSTYFKTNTGRLIDSIKLAESQLEKIRVLVETDIRAVELIQLIEEKISSYLEYSNAASEESKKEKSMEEELHNIEAEMSKKATGIESLLAGEEWKKLISCKAELEMVNRDIQAIENKLTEELSIIRKPLNRLEHDSNGLDMTAEDKEFMESQKSGKTSIDNITKIKVFIQTLEGLVKEGKVQLKEKEKEKISELKNKLDSADMVAITNRHRELSRAKTEAENKLLEASYILKVREEIEANIRDMGGKIKLIKSEIDSASKRILSLHHENEKIISEIKSTLASVSPQLKLDVS